MSIFACVAWGIAIYTVQSAVSAQLKGLPPTRSPEVLVTTKTDN